MKRITVKELNIKYKEYLKYTIESAKNRFGWYTAYLKNGSVCIGSTLNDLEEDIKSKIK